MTALAPHIGYTASTSLARQALALGRTIKDVTTEGGLLTDQLGRDPAAREPHTDDEWGDSPMRDAT
ncbi:hypothetical protein [Streptomyces scabiei]|uniref:hypothetical protein n=1 Tax=Streptomyces scabiei TaxID=1930 RepID=UPI0004E6C786|nr:hypothetical protein [Streptomyces scabiei]KFG05936.1 hypothetical protein IQ61_27520 [Streptomyces scabiei]MDX2837396.1 hypothetical protein [Streptomyces scabiei]MDX3681948.1 hypothetical protein [Streptomyces scabiei]